jgi:hypothetical protein
VSLLTQLSISVRPADHRENNRFSQSMGVAREQKLQILPPSVDGTVADGSSRRVERLGELLGWQNYSAARV